MNVPSGSALLIAGLDTVAVSRLPSLFAAAGFAVDLLAPQGLAASRSRAVRKHFHLDRGSGTIDSARQFVTSHAGRYAATVIADEPTFLAALQSGATNLDSVKWMHPWCPIPLTSESLARTLSKTQFLLDCRDKGILTPPFEVCDFARTLDVADSIGYPVFLKAVQGLSGSGLRYAVSREDLKPQLGVFADEPSILVQQEVRGQPGSVSVFYRNGKPACWFPYLMKQTWPNRFAAACTIETFHHGDILPLVTAVGEMTDFNGLCAIDFIYNPQSGRCYLLELNPRPGPAYYLGHHAGIDFAAALRDWREGKISNPREPSERGGQIVHMFPQALFHAVDGFHPRQFMQAMQDAPLSDPGLAAAHLRRLITHYVRHAIARR